VVAISELRKVLSEFVRNELSAAWGDSAVSRELVEQFVVGALLAVLTWWLERRPRLTASQADAMFRRLVFNGIGPSIRAKSRGGCLASPDRAGARPVATTGRLQRR
jgi:hypothetical protein